MFSLKKRILSVSYYSNSLYIHCNVCENMLIILSSFTKAVRELPYKKDNFKYKDLYICTRHEFHQKSVKNTSIYTLD